jgi:uncharacterized delta-60 repeat protein
VEPLESRQLLSAGALDPTFGSGGKVLASFSNLSADNEASAVALQPDGKIVVAGSVPSAAGDFDFGVVRFNADGSLDSGFGDGGMFVIPFNLGAGSNDFASAVALQPDDKIVLAGSAASVADGRDFAVTRLTPAGAYDNTFGHGGETFFAFHSGNTNSDVARAVALQPDGKIVLAGTADNALAVARLKANGDLDGTFGSGGHTTVANLTIATGVALQPDGKIVLAANLTFAIPAPSSQFAATRLQANGTPDSTFGSGGTGTIFVHFSGSQGFDSAQAVALQPDGKIVLAGSTSVGFAAARLSTSGVLDGAFGSGGAVTVPFNTGGFQSGSANAVALKPDGKIVLAGFAQVSDTASDFAAARLSAAGTLDGSFGSGGQTTFAFGSQFDQARGVAIQSDGKIVLAGTSQAGGSSFHVALARLTGDAPPLTPPTVTAVTVLRGGHSGKVQGLLVAFSEALDPASAQDLAHYKLLIPARGKGKMHRPRAVPILSAVYNQTTHAVTLTLGKLKATDTQGMLEVMGVADPADDVLAGSALFVLNLRSRRKH